MFVSVNNIFENYYMLIDKYIHFGTEKRSLP